MTKTNTAPATSSAQDVREWAKKNLSRIDEVAHKSIAGRGRPHPKAVEAFNRFHSKRPYSEGTPKAEAQIKVKVPVVGADGRTRNKVVTITAKEVRDFKGHAPKTRGRLSKADMQEFALTLV